MARSDPTEFVVEVLEGPLSGESIRLNGRMKPYRAGAGGSISFGKVARTKLTWYPGNRKASQQNLGAILPPTTINGIWKERYLGGDVPISLVELFEQLVETQVQVRVYWETVERQGEVKQINWAPGDPVGGIGDIRWEIVFEWNAADTRIRRSRALGDTNLSLRDGLTRAANAIGTLGNLITDLVTNTRLFVGSVNVAFGAAERTYEDILEDLEPSLTTLAQTAGMMADEPSLPARHVEEASTAAGSVEVTAKQACEVTSGLFPAATTVGDSIEVILEDYLARHEVVEEGLKTEYEVFEQRVRLEDIIRPDTYLKVPALVGGDLREFAIRYYGDADKWDRIAKQNDLETSLIPDDLEELVIPLSLPDATDEKVDS